MVKRPRSGDTPVGSRRALVAAVALVAAGSLAAAIPARAQTAAVRADTAPGGPVFSHGVITDMQRSGFEPGIQIDGKDRLYTSVPYGFSDTQSFLWSSEDNGNSYQLIPASVGTGKTQTCVGGGDSELALDPKNDLFFSDLQGLTNLSNSVTTDAGRTFSTSCTAVPNAPVDRMWYAMTPGKSLGDPGFTIYEEYDDVDGGVTGTATSNQLVEVQSTDGVTFTPTVNSGLGSATCLGGGAVNCVTNDEGIPGNQIINKAGQLVIAHTGSDSKKVEVSVGTPATTAAGTPAESWKNVTLNGAQCSAAGGNVCGAALFATIAQDTAGDLYVVSASAGSNSGGTQTTPYQVYLWTSKDGGSTWSTGVPIGSTDGSNAFPWITAGDPGRVDVTYYHATETSEGGLYKFDNLTKGSFTVELAQSLNALDAAPSFSHTTVSEHPVKYGPICTAGLGCTVSGGDRSLGDYLQVGHDARGAAVVAYVDDTSNAYAPPTTGDTAETGPAEIVRQIGGPSLFTTAGGGTGTVPGAGPGPTAQNECATDPTADTFYSADGTKTAAGDNLDLTGACITDDGSGGFVITMKVKSLASLLVSPTAGGTTGEWITRFTTYNAGATPGNGHILYAGMESVAGQAPTFFSGDTQRARLFMTYQQEGAATGSYDAATGTITVKVPASALPADYRATTDPTMTKLYSVTAFTATSAATLKSDPEGLFNLTDATTPFDHVVGASAVTPTLPEAAMPALLVLGAGTLLGAVAVRRRRRRA